MRARLSHVKLCALGLRNAILGNDLKQFWCCNILVAGEEYLTIIPRAQMGYESIAHEAEGRMGFWLRAHEGERNNCFSTIQLVGQKNIETKHLSLVKARL